MKDPRIDQLAHNLIFYSCRVKPGDKVLIEATGQHFELVNALVAAAYEAKALPFVWLREASTQRALLMGMTQEQIDLYKPWVLANTFNTLASMDDTTSGRQSTVPVTSRRA